MPKEINLSKLADEFCWTHPQPKDHNDMMYLMANFARHIAEKLLKEAAHNAAQLLILERVTPSIAFDVHDNIIDTLDTYL